MTVANTSSKSDPNRPVSWRSSRARSAALRATQSVTRTILQSSKAIGRSELNEFPDWFHENVGRYLRGTQAMEEHRLMEIVRLAYDRDLPLLNEDQISHLGYLPLVEGELAKIVDIDTATSAVRRSRERAKRQFDEGIARLLKGEMPLKAGRTDGRKGTIIRKHLSENEMAKNYAKWISRIEALGGRVTKETWAPNGYHEAEAAYWASISDWERDFHADHIQGLVDAWYRNCEDETDCGMSQQSAPRPPWHPANLRDLKLWFGGREWSSWHHAIEDDWAEVRGDDLSNFLDALDAREEARYQTRTTFASKA
ncbi:hypothetical protein AAGS40_00865 [Paraburkholderia sp. PREW-6R]|uniref:hypothetical protein n=1 Tax=Paraburkholderia sp. PREW-6R TaxID=3141544 RepID=UPI0031F4E383